MVAKFIAVSLIGPYFISFQVIDLVLGVGSEKYFLSQVGYPPLTYICLDIPTAIGQDNDGWFALKENIKHE